MSNCNCRKLNIFGFAMALGLLWGTMLFITAWFSEIGGYGVPFIRLMGSIYIGYCPGLEGAIIGAVWGFVDAFIGGIIFTSLYNLFTGSCKGDCCQTGE